MLRKVLLLLACLVVAAFAAEPAAPAPVAAAPAVTAAAPAEPAAPAAPAAPVAPAAPAAPETPVAPAADAPRKHAESDYKDGPSLPTLYTPPCFLNPPPFVFVLLYQLFPLSFFSRVAAFKKFVEENKKTYNSTEEPKRYAIFKDNYDKVHDNNANGGGFKMALNKFSDLTPAEFRAKMLSPMPADLQKKLQEQSKTALAY
jgi:nucleoid-associated protein YgaU